MRLFSKFWERPACRARTRVVVGFPWASQFRFIGTVVRSKPLRHRDNVRSWPLFHTQMVKASPAALRESPVRDLASVAWVAGERASALAALG
jgi:hypothetical protein